MSIKKGNISAFFFFFSYHSASTDRQKKTLLTSLPRPRFIHASILSHHHTHTSSIQTSASTYRTTLRASKPYININSSHQKPSTMTTPRPVKGGVTVAKSRDDSGPQPVGNRPVYPRGFPNGEWETVIYRSVVTKVAAGPGKFEVRCQQGQNIFPTQLNGSLLDIPIDPDRDNGYLQDGAAYTVTFRRDIHNPSRETTPYEYYETIRAAY